MTQGIGYPTQPSAKTVSALALRPTHPGQVTSGVTK
jgi:hypothetical protein